MPVWPPPASRDDAVGSRDPRHSVAPAPPGSAASSSAVAPPPATWCKHANAYLLGRAFQRRASSKVPMTATSTSKVIASRARSADAGSRPLPSASGRTAPPASDNDIKARLPMPAHRPGWSAAGSAAGLVRRGDHHLPELALRGRPVLRSRPVARRGPRSPPPRDPWPTSGRSSLPIELRAPSPGSASASRTASARSRRGRDAVGSTRSRNSRDHRRGRPPVIDRGRAEAGSLVSAPWTLTTWGSPLATSRWTSIRTLALGLPVLVP